MTAERKKWVHSLYIEIDCGANFIYTATPVINITVRTVKYCLVTHVHNIKLCKKYKWTHILLIIIYISVVQTVNQEKNKLKQKQIYLSTFPLNHTSKKTKTQNQKFSKLRATHHCCYSFVNIWFSVVVYLNVCCCLFVCFLLFVCYVFVLRIHVYCLLHYIHVCGFFIFLFWCLTTKFDILYSDYWKMI